MKSINKKLLPYVAVGIGSLFMCPQVLGFQSTKANAATHKNTVKVEEGETLSSIANKYGVSAQTIARQNNISNPNQLNVNQVITLNGSAQKQQAHTQFNANETTGVWGNVKWSYNGHGIVTFTGSSDGKPAVLGQRYSNNDPFHKIHGNNVTKIIINSPISAYNGLCAPDSHGKAESNSQFADLNNLQSIDGLANLNTSSMTNMSRMFDDDDELTELNLSSFDTSKVKDMVSMIGSSSNSNQLKTLILGPAFTTANANVSNIGQGLWKLGKVKVAGNSVDFKDAAFRTYDNCSWNFNSDSTEKQDGAISSINTKLKAGTYNWYGEPAKDGAYISKHQINFVNQNNHQVISSFDMSGVKDQDVTIATPNGFVLPDGKNSKNAQITWPTGDKPVNISVIPDPKNPQPEISENVSFFDEGEKSVSDKDGNNSFEINGFQGTQHDITDEIPAGYKLKNEQNSSVIMDGVSKQITLLRDSSTDEYAKGTITFKDAKDNIVNPSQKIYQDITDDKSPLKVEVPNGYKLKDPSKATIELHKGDNSQDISVVKVNQPKIAKGIITFKDPSGKTIEPSQSINNIDITNNDQLTLKIPDGYKLVHANQSIITLHDGDNSQNIDVTKIENPSDKIATGNVTFRDTATGKILSDVIPINQKISGDNETLPVTAPRGYHFTDGNITEQVLLKDGDSSEQYDVTPNKPSSETVTYTIKWDVINSEDSNKVNVPNNNINLQTTLNPTILTGKPGSYINIAGHVPGGYELVDGQNIPTQFGNFDSNPTFNLEKITDAHQVNETINFMDGSQNVKSTTLSGMTGSIVQVSGLPDNYVLVNKGDSSINLTGQTTNISVEKVGGDAPDNGGNTPNNNGGDIPNNNGNNTPKNNGSDVPSNDNGSTTPTPSNNDKTTAPAENVPESSHKTSSRVAKHKAQHAKGILPQTGEHISAVFAVIGSLLIAMLGIFKLVDIRKKHLQNKNR